MKRSFSSHLRAGAGMPRSPSLVAEAFGDVLRGVRIRRDLTAGLVAARARISIEQLDLIEQGQMTPRLSVLFRFAGAVGVTPVWLLDEVIAWLAPHARPARDTTEASPRITDQDFVYQLIYGAHARPWRSHL